jgi:uncharacterized protein (DUF433 family)
VTQETHLGVGLYTYPEAARIIGVKPAKLRRWATEYRYRANGHHRSVQPVISRYFEDEPVLTFLEVVELLFVRLFREHGVSMPMIRRAAQRAAEEFESDYPFAVERFDTDGKHIFATLRREAESDREVQDVARGQLAFERVVKPFFRKLEYRGDALKLWPRDRDGRVVIDPQRGFGKPIDAESGVPTEVLYRATIAGEGQSVESVAEWFGVPVEAVQAAVDYELRPEAA